MIGIDPTVDFAFKKMLGSPDHKQITLHFLNSILHVSPRITDVTILNPFLAKDFETDKLAVLDVLACDDYGRQLNVEMQTSVPTAMGQRLAYYASSLYVSQLNAGQDYPSLRPAISICVLNATMFAATPEMHLDFRLRSTDCGSTLTDNLQIHTLELPKYTPDDNNEMVTNPVEQWAFFLRFASSLTVPKIASRLTDPIFTEAAEVLKMIAITPEERMAYDARLKFQRDAAARLLSAREEALQQGREEGLELGRQEGRQEGHQEGVQLGEARGEVRLLRRLLGQSDAMNNDIDDLDQASLEALAVELQEQLRQRG